MIYEREIAVVMLSKAETGFSKYPTRVGGPFSGTILTVVIVREEQRRAEGSVST